MFSKGILMVFPQVTAFYAALLGLVFTGLSFWVVKARAHHKVAMGDDGQFSLILRIRSHANFAEYVPLGLILIAFNEMAGLDPWEFTHLAQSLCLRASLTLSAWPRLRGRRCKSHFAASASLAPGA